MNIILFMCRKGWRPEMKMNIEVPIILEDQQKIVEWSRRLKNNHIDMSTAIEYLVSDKKTESEYISEGLEEVRKIYMRKNNNWRKEVLLAIMIDNYRLENDIKEGQMVTNGNYIGYAFNVDYKTRDFTLYSSKDNESDFVDNFKIDDFKRIR